MPFCSNCGTDVTNKSFCGQCGTPAGAAPVHAVAAPPPSTARVKPIYWILGGIAGFILLILIAVGSTGLFFAHKFADNPALATAKLLTAANPNVEVLSTDQAHNTVTFRDKQTNETVTMNFDDIKNGKMVVKSNGKEATIQAHGTDQNGGVEINSSDGTVKIGSGTNAKVPAWVPVYPGVTPQVNFSMQGKDGDGGTFQFQTNDPPADVLAYYQKGLREAGFKITSNISGNAAASSGAMLTAEDASSKRTIMVTAGTADKGSSVNVVFGTNNK